MNRNCSLTALLITVLSCFWGVESFGQLAEIKAFDTTKNEHASADRIYADALKENLLNNRKEAEVLFNRFLKARPNVAGAYYELARINMKDNNPVRALQHIKKAISLDSSNKWYQEFYANILVGANKFSEAADIFSTLAKKFKPNDEYLLKSAQLYNQSKKYSKAIEQLEQLIADKGNNEDWLIQIHQLYRKANKIDSAAHTLQRLIDAYPREGRYYALLAELYLNSNQMEKAKKIFEKSEQLFPDDISVLLGMASYYKHKKDTARYTEYVNKSITSKSIDEQTQITLLVTYLQEMGRDSAVRDNAYLLCQQLIQEHPDNATLYAIAGDLLSFKGKQKEAIESFKSSLRIEPNNLNIWQQLLFGLSDKADADSMLHYSNEALSLFPSSAMLHYLQGIGYINKTQYNKGIKSIETAIDFQPADNKALLAEMFASIADAQHAQKNYELADKNFEKALALTPENATVLNNYAYYLSLRKVRLDDAEKMSAKSLELRPGEATFLDTYGWIWYQKGNYDKAKQHIEEAIRKNGDQADATLYEHLGDIYYKMNQLDEALKNWGIALSKDPNNTQIAQKIKNKKIDE